MDTKINISKCIIVRIKEDFSLIPITLINMNVNIKDITPPMKEFLDASFCAFDQVFWSFIESFVLNPEYLLILDFALNER